MDLKKIFAGEAACLTVEDSFSMQEVCCSGYYPFVSPVMVKAVVSAFAGAAKLEADVSYTFCMPCDRCAEPVTVHRTHHFSHMLVRTMNTEDNDTYVLVENDELDLCELLYSDVILELPTKFLCKEDCRGLCPKCGANLNKTTCSCQIKEIDPRLEVLKNLIN